MLIINLNKSGDYYTWEQFPDKSLKFKLDLQNVDLKNSDEFWVKGSLLSNDDLIRLALVKDVLDRTFPGSKKILYITYMMYQQDDRMFSKEESFGLKIISKFINSTNFDEVKIYHPHSDKVEFIDNCEIVSNQYFLITSLKSMHYQDTNKPCWVIPDSGAFKTQFKQIQKLNWPNFIVCNKSRDFNTGQITTVLSTSDLQGRDCFIVDDLCLGGRTFLNIAEELKKVNCGKLSLIISHGIFNNGVEHLLEKFDTIYTTDSYCKLENQNVKIYKL